MASAMTALATITLGSSAATVTFGSIPATYRDLRIIVNGGATASSDQMRIRINGDSTASYWWVNMRGTGSAAQSSAVGAAQTSSILDLFGNGLGTTLNGQYIVDLLDYSATDKHKSFLCRADDATQGSHAIAGRWTSTSAITSIQLYDSGTTFLAGSVFSLYGISA